MDAKRLDEQIALFEQTMTFRRMNGFPIGSLLVEGVDILMLIARIRALEADKAGEAERIKAEREACARMVERGAACFKPKRRGDPPAFDAVHTLKAAATAIRARSQTTSAPR